jgi:hypothetical protein
MTGVLVRASSIFVVVLLLIGGAGRALAAAQDDFARGLSGPWGRVDANWRPLIGALSKNSCPLAGVSRRENVGLFGEGGAMWIEPTFAGALDVYDGGPVPRLFAFVRMDGDGAAVYREAGVERRLARLGADRLSENRLPVVEGLPGTNYVRCLKKR